AHPGIEVRYDSNALRLDVAVPIEWLPEQRFSAARRRSHIPARSDTGALVSYDFYAADLPNDARTASVWSEQRVFGALGVLRNSGIYRHSSRTNPLTDTTIRDSGFIRYDTQWSNADE